MVLKIITVAVIRKQRRSPATIELADSESDEVNNPVSDEVGDDDGVVVPIEDGSAPEPPNSKVIFVSGDVIMFFLFVFSLALGYFSINRMKNQEFFGVLLDFYILFAEN